MHKNKFFNISFFTITILYAIIMFLYALGVYPFSLIYAYWFELFLLFMGLINILRAILFKSDSGTIIGSVLLINFVIFLIRNILNLKFIIILPMIIASFAISAFIAYLFFKNKLYLKSFLIIGAVAILSCNLYWLI